MRARILFATLALDGHFNPLTDMAVHLRKQGHDVRWYTGNIYRNKLHSLEIPHYPFQKALEIHQHNLEEMFPERNRYTRTLRKLQFDLLHYFIGQAASHVEDITALHEEFAFDLLIADVGFVAAPVIRETLCKPVVVMGLTPLLASSENLAPYGTGLLPASSRAGKIHHQLLRWFTQHVLFRKSTRACNKLFAAYDIQPTTTGLFNTIIQRSDLFLQSGVPGFEYSRSDMSERIRFVGPLLPYDARQTDAQFPHQEKLKRYKRVVLVTQGMIEKDMEKLLVPTLEGLKDTPYLVVATTAGNHTQELRQRYPQDNIIIEDYIDFNAIMPYAHVFVTNGGYGSVMMSIMHQLPMVAAGIHEGRNEVCARIAYSKTGINLRTEFPSASQIRKSVEEVMHDQLYQKNAAYLSQEFRQHDPHVLCGQYIEELLPGFHTAAGTASDRSFPQHELEITGSER